MSIALALESIAPEYKYIGSLTAENKQAFDSLVDISGIKPSWGEISAEANRISTEEALNKSDEVLWRKYQKDREENEKEKWKQSGKPDFVPAP